MANNNILFNIGYDDQFLPDPFNPTFEAICAITTFSEHRIPQHLAGKPHAIAREIYKTAKAVDLWWVLKLYNGLVHSDEFAPGAVIRAPDINAISFILGERLNDKATDDDFVEI